MQQNLKAQGSVTRQQVANFSLAPHLFNHIIFLRNSHKQFTHSDEKELYDHHTPLEDHITSAPVWKFRFQRKTIKFKAEG